MALRSAVTPARRNPSAIITWAPMPTSERTVSAETGGWPARYRRAFRRGRRRWSCSPTLPLCHTAACGLASGSVVEGKRKGGSLLKADELKEEAARAALDLVEDGMRLGLGSGSTAARFVAALGERVAAGLRVICVPTSEATRLQAEQLGIPLSTLDETPELNLTVDGADEIDAELRLIKGGGGALLREKIVATASDRMVV